MSKMRHREVKNLAGVVDGAALGIQVVGWLSEPELLTTTCYDLMIRMSTL